MSRRPKFEINITINELTNIPQMSGVSWVRWYITDSPKPDARGRTHRFPVKDHRVLYHDTHSSLTHHIRINSQNTLRECTAIFDVMWAQSGSSEKILLGKAEANLSEYVNQNPQPTRFLLRDSKVNCTLSLTFNINQLSGPKGYKV